MVADGDVAGLSRQLAAKKAAAKRASGRGASVVERRRQEEDVLEEYKALAKSNFKVKTLAVWEANTQASIQRNEVARIAAGLREEYNDGVEARRARLAGILDVDAVQLKKELDALMETPGQRKERLKARTLKIREVKEAANSKYIEEQLRRQFRATSDDLRFSEGKNLMLICERERRLQLENKKLLKASELVEEQKWDELWEVNRQGKIEREAEEALQRKRMDQITYEEIDVQVGALQKRRAQQKEQRGADTQQRLAKMKADEAQAIAEYKEKQEDATRRRVEVMKINAEFQARRAAEKAQDTHEHVRLIEAQHNEDHETKLQEKAEKKRLVQDMKHYLAYRESEKEAQLALDHQLEQLRNAELAKVSHKQDLVWQKEQLAREKLMKEVLESRQMQLLEKAEIVAREKRTLQGERATLLNTLHSDNDSGHDNYALDRIKKAAMSSTLKSQMEDNRYRREVDRAERFYEMRAAQIAEQAFQEQLQKEIEHDKNLLGTVMPSFGLKQNTWE